MILSVSLSIKASLFQGMPITEFLRQRLQRKAPALFLLRRTCSEKRARTPKRNQQWNKE
jgi:hypothetical protein